MFQNEKAPFEKCSLRIKAFSGNFRRIVKLSHGPIAEPVPRKRLGEMSRVERIPGEEKRASPDPPSDCPRVLGAGMDLQANNLGLLLSHGNGLRRVGR
jgi:hypothetical protein